MIQCPHQMELLREKFIKKVVALVVEPVITTDIHNDGELGVSFYSICLGFSNILDYDSLRKELSFILRGSEIDEVLERKKLKLEDVFAKYINDKDNENNMAKTEAFKISEAYTQLIKSELQFILDH